MGGLVARSDLGQALLIASGQSVYAFALDGNPPEHVARFPGKVRGLALHNDAVVAGGKFKGIRELLTCGAVAGRFSMWRMLASYDGGLYGVPDEKGRRGEIWNVATQRSMVRREGEVTALAGGKRLSDASMRIQEHFGIRHAHADVFDTFSDIHILEHSRDGISIDALSWYDAWTLLYGERSFVHAAVLDGEPSSRFRWRRVDSDTFRARKGIQNICEEEKGPLKRMWERVREYCAQDSGSLPKDVSAFSAPHPYRRSGWKGPVARVPFCLMPYDEALRHLCPGMHEGTSTDARLREVLESLRESLLDYEESRHAVSAVVCIDDTVLLGTRSGRLEQIADEGFTVYARNLPEHDERLIRQFSRPVAAVLAIPLEVYDEGIRQRAAANRGRRAYFAKGVSLPEHRRKYA